MGCLCVVPAWCRPDSQSASVVSFSLSFIPFCSVLHQAGAFHPQNHVDELLHGQSGVRHELSAREGAQLQERYRRGHQHDRLEDDQFQRVVLAPLHDDSAGSPVALSSSAGPARELSAVVRKDLDDDADHAKRRLPKEDAHGILPRNAAPYEARFRAALAGRYPFRSSRHGSSTQGLHRGSQENRE